MHKQQRRPPPDLRKLKWLLRRQRRLFASRRAWSKTSTGLKCWRIATLFLSGRQLKDLKTQPQQGKKNQKPAQRKQNRSTASKGYNQGSKAQTQSKKNANSGKVQKSQTTTPKKKTAQKKKQVKTQKSVPRTQEQLDNELAEYMKKTKGGLDAELDSYMSQAAVIERVVMEEFALVEDISWRQ